jgi:hypothetical protein
LVQLAPGLGYRAAIDLDPLASSEIPVILALEIETGSTTDSS